MAHRERLLRVTIASAEPQIWDCHACGLSQAPGGWIWIPEGWRVVHYTWRAMGGQTHSKTGVACSVDCALNLLLRWEELEPAVDVVGAETVEQKPSTNTDLLSDIMGKHGIHQVSNHDLSKADPERETSIY